MKDFFQAKSVAVIGVSARPGNLARNIVANMENFAYQGEVYFVSPSGGEYKGKQVYKDVRDIPGPVELAVILTPAAFVPGLMNACGEKGIKRVVVETGGFSELSDQGNDLAKELQDAASKHSIRFIGPNCIGFVAVDNGLAVPFALIDSNVRKGGVSIVAQSGGVGLTYLHRLASERVGIAKFITVGNKLNVNEQDLLAYLADDPQTEVIVMYLESIVAGREIFDIIRATDKPVIVHKSNIAEMSNAIASSHTAALSNDELVVDSALDQAGAVRVNTVYECLQAVKGVTLPRAKGKRVTIISRSGGHAVVAADAAYRNDLELPTLPASYLEPIQEEFRASVIKLQNPLDLGDVFNHKIYEGITRGALALDNVDSVMVVLAYRGPEIKPSRKFISQAQALGEAAGKPLALTILADPDELEAAKAITSLPIFDTPEDGILALSANYRTGLRHRPAETTACADDIDWERVERIVGGVAGEESLELPEALLLLDAAGVPVADFGVAGSPKEAADLAEMLSGPVALKAVGASVSHKTEHGGVQLNLSEREEIMTAASDMFERLKINRLVVMSMVTGGTEVIVGAKQDPAFGPLVLFGLGGVTAEAYADVSLRLAPVDDVEAGQMVDGIRAARLLKGFRGAPAVNRMALLEVIMRVSLLAARVPALAELDINPLLAGPGGAVAVDARCSLKTIQ